MIPRTFTLVNKRWLVRIVTTKQLQTHIDKTPVDGEEDLAKHMLGLCDPTVNRLFLNKDLHTEEADLEHTFWHEFVHALKYANGERTHDEEEVDRIAGFLHQYEITKR